MSIPSKSITKNGEHWRSLAGEDAAASASVVSDNRLPIIRRWIVDPTNSAFVQFLRYGLVGGIAFLCDFGTLWGATSRLGLHYLHAAALGFCVGLAVNYWLSVRWVFTKRKFSRSSVQFGLFALVGIVGVGINELGMWLLTDGVGLDYRASKLATTVVVYLWNFSIRKVLIF